MITVLDIYLYMIAVEFTKILKLLSQSIPKSTKSVSVFLAVKGLCNKTETIVKYPNWDFKKFKEN